MRVVSDRSSELVSCDRIHLGLEDRLFLASSISFVVISFD